MKEIVFKTPITLYTLMDNKGQFFKSGYFSESNWTDDINKAKVYTTIAPARSWATKFAKENPDKPIPQILMISTSCGILVDETVRVLKAQEVITKAKVSKQTKVAMYNLELARLAVAKAKNV